MATTESPPEPQPDSATPSPNDAASPDQAAAPGWLGWAYALVVFLSAFLLFQVQPLVSKAILPWFGGTPSVWTVCMLFFQSLLFGGYAYSHLVTTRLDPKVRMGLHLVLLAVACAMLPILPGVEWKPTGSENPAFRIVAMLLATVGLPFFVLSTTGPLLQAWFAGTHPGRSPYRLYALSNIGSLLALLSYPFVFEPMMGLSDQSSTWSWAFMTFAVSCAACGVAAVAFRREEEATTATDPASADPGTNEESTDDPAAGTAPTLGTMGLWFTLATVPSIMLLATTNQVCLDVASVPFLWVLPLSLYLLSFILCFDSDWWYSRTGYGLGVVLTGGGMIAALAGGPAWSIQTQVGVFFAGLFCSAMFCHGELARLKPHPRYLTQFYLVMSAGGAAGGLFTGLLAPVLFTGYYELHIAILATAILVFLIDTLEAHNNPEYRGWSRPVLLAIVVVLAIGLGWDVNSQREDVILSTRNFYGVLRVEELEDNRRLVHGRILHGKQYTKDIWRRWPTTYYGRASGVGLAMTHHHVERPRVLGVVGLGTGTIATYAREGDKLVYYEINQDVVDIAESHFTFLKDCQGERELVLGDARLSLERELADDGPRRFDVLALDAFSSDAIPAHLLTKEAMQLYLDHLAEDGILAVHISNKHFDLDPILAGHADDFDLALQIVNSQDFSRRGVSSASWVLLSRNPDVLVLNGYSADDVPDRYLHEEAIRKAWLDQTAEPNVTLYVNETEVEGKEFNDKADFDLPPVRRTLVRTRVVEVVRHGWMGNDDWSLLLRRRDLSRSREKEDLAPDKKRWIKHSSWTDVLNYPDEGVDDDGEPVGRRIHWTDDATNLVDVLRDFDLSDLWDDFFG